MPGVPGLHCLVASRAHAGLGTAGGHLGFSQLAQWVGFFPMRFRVLVENLPPTSPVPR